VSVTPAADWLSGRTQGIAIGTLAPARVFRIPTGGTGIAPSATGPVTVRPLSDTLPLAVLPLQVARPAITDALTHLERDAAYTSWLQTQQDKLQQTAICASDDVPTPIPVDLTEFLPFLALD
jgi:hypothetical protein